MAKPMYMCFCKDIREKLFPLTTIFLAVSGTYSKMLYLVYKINTIVSLNLFEVFNDCLSNLYAAATSGEFMGGAYLQALDAYHFSYWFISIVV